MYKTLWKELWKTILPLNIQELCSVPLFRLSITCSVFQINTIVYRPRFDFTKNLFHNLRQIATFRVFPSLVQKIFFVVLKTRVLLKLVQNKRTTVFPKNVKCFFQQEVITVLSFTSLISNDFHSHSYGYMIVFLQEVNEKPINELEASLLGL